jgi:hypothetical protein
MGYVPPVRGRARKKLRAAATELYAQNWSTRQIGLYLGHAHSTIRVILVEAGVTIRPRGGARVSLAERARIDKEAAKGRSRKS